MDKTETTVGEDLTILAFAAITIPLGIVYQGYVLSWMWLWFIVPLGMIPAISALHGAGLMTIFNYLISDVQKTRIEQKKDVLSAAWLLIVLNYIAPSFALFIAWVIASIM